MNKIDKLKEAVEKKPESAVAHLNLGTFLLLNKQNAKEAEKEMRLAVELNPDYDKAWVNLGGLHLARWEFEACVEANKKAIAINPKLVEAHYNLGLGFLYLKDVDEMIACFKRVLELDPKNPGGYYNLAVGLLHKGNVMEARAYSIKAEDLGYSLDADFIKELEKQLKKLGSKNKNSDGQPAVTELGSKSNDKKL